MRKIIFSILFFMVSTLVLAQGDGNFNIGLKLGLAVSTNRVTSESDTISFLSNGTGGRLIFGPVMDFAFGENYYFSSGLLFTSKRAAFKAINKNTSLENEEVYSLQYLQVPLSIKLFTNEVSLDTKVYFQIGGVIEANISEKSKKDSNFYVLDFTQFDTSIVLGTGLEFKMGTNTTLFAGFSYQRGLINVVNTTVDIDKKLILKNDMLSIDLGIKL